MIRLLDALFLPVASPTAGAALDCGRTALDAVLLLNAKGAALPAAYVEADGAALAAGVVHLASPLPSTANAPWTLAHSKTLLSLPPGLFWKDRHEWQGGLSQTATPTSGGITVIQSFQMMSGRKISLDPPSADNGLMDYADLALLDGFASTAGRKFVLEVGGERHLVQFARPALSPKPALGFSNFRDGERWAVSLFFITV